MTPGNFGRKITKAPKVAARKDRLADVDYIPEKEDLLILNPKQEEFCLLYCSRPDLTARECAELAGYERGGGWSFNLLQMPAVVARIKQLRQEYQHKYNVTIENHLEMLAYIRNEALRAGNYGAAVSAETNRGKAAGLYIERKEILHGKIDQMSKEEVMKEIEKLVKEYPALADSLTPKVIDVIPSEVKSDEQET